VNNENFLQALKQAAEKFLTQIPTEQNQVYLSEVTWGLIENRQVARAQSNSDLEHQLGHRATQTLNINSMQPLRD
jgi:hypothetical protein